MFDNFLTYAVGAPAYALRQLFVAPARCLQRLSLWVRWLLRKSQRPTISRWVIIETLAAPLAAWFWFWFLGAFGWLSWPSRSRPRSPRSCASGR